MPTGIEWIATQDSPGAFNRTFYRAVLLHALDEVIAACWRESTVTSKQRTQTNLVTAHTEDQKLTRNLNDSFKQIHFRIPME